MKNCHLSLRVGVLATLLCFSLAASIQAQTFPIYKSLHAFGGNITCANGKAGPDGTASTASVTFDSFGNMYGTTTQGGFFNQGMVWEITKSGVYKDLHDFGGAVTNANGTHGPDGTQPWWQVTFDRTGNMFGTTSYGGPFGTGNDEGGNLWEITKAGVYKDLHDFGGTTTDGQSPQSGVTFDGAGNMYGATWNGGANNNSGMLWEMTKSGAYKDLHDFGGTVTNASGTQGPDGAFPNGLIAFDADGSVFGLTYNGGPNIDSFGAGSGVLWEMTKAGLYKDLHGFGGSTTSSSGEATIDGIDPNSGVTLDSAGNLYGTTQYGGPNFWQQGYRAGMVWEFTKSGHYKDLHDFGGQTVNSDGQSGSDGTLPLSTVVIDHNGNLYGTTSFGGEYYIPSVQGEQGNGIVWQITKGGAYKDLYDFYATKSPYAGVTLDAAGNLFGTTASANADVTGNVWQLCTTASIESLMTDASSTTLVGGESYTGTLTLNGISIAGETISLSSSSASLKLPQTVTIAAGQNLVTFSITTTAVTHAESVRVSAKGGGSTETLVLIVAPLSVANLTISPTSVQGGSTTAVTATVTLDGVAPSAGAVVTLSSSDPSTAAVPKTVTLASGLSSTTFTITTSSVTRPKTVTIKATYGGITKTATLKVTP